MSVYPRDCYTAASCEALENDICYGLYHGTIQAQLSTAFSTSNWVQTYNLVICVLNVWFASVIYRNQKLQVHPMKLFMGIAIADSIYSSNRFFSHFACFMGLPKLMDYTVFYHLGVDSRYRAVYQCYYNT